MPHPNVLVSGLARGLDFLVTASGTIAAVVAVLMVTMVAVGTISRYVFQLPFLFIEEYGGYMLVVITLMGASYTLRKGGHVNVDIIVRRLSPRAQARLAVVTDILSVLFVVVLIIQTAKMAAAAFAVSKVSMTVVQTPLGPVYLLMPIGLALLSIELLRAFSQAIKSAYLKSPKPEIGEG
jgi:TRAP-type C4-dicarboxylate transport system permease small subunit